MAAQYDLFRISAKSPNVRDRHEIRAESIKFTFEPSIRNARLISVKSRLTVC